MCNLRAVTRGNMLSQRPALGHEQGVGKVMMGFGMRRAQPGVHNGWWISTLSTKQRSLHGAGGAIYTCSQQSLLLMALSCRVHRPWQQADGQVI